MACQPGTQPCWDEGRGRWWEPGDECTPAPRTCLGGLSVALKRMTCEMRAALARPCGTWNCAPSLCAMEWQMPSMALPKAMPAGGGGVRLDGVGGQQWEAWEGGRQGKDAGGREAGSGREWEALGVRAPCLGSVSPAMVAAECTFSRAS